MKDSSHNTTKADRGFAAVGAGPGERGGATLGLDRSARSARAAHGPPDKLGEVPEWTKGHAWRACVPLPVPRVRIPPSPLSRRVAHTSPCALKRSRILCPHAARVERWRLGPAQERRREPRQVRKEATVTIAVLCRRAP